MTVEVLPSLSSSQEVPPAPSTKQDSFLNAHRRSRSDTKISYNDVVPIVLQTKRLPKDLLTALTTIKEDEDIQDIQYDIQNISIDIFSIEVTTQHIPVPPPPPPPPPPPIKARKYKNKVVAPVQVPVQAAPAGPPETCPVCFEDVDRNAMHTFNGCFHRYCGECVSEHLRISIENGKARKLKCLNPSCTVQFPGHLVYQFVDSKTLAKYNLFISTPADCTWCPAPGCDTPMVKDDAAGNMGICKCGMKFCFDCRTPWHEGETCEEFKARGGPAKSKEEQASLDLALAEGVQPCPKCGIWAEKVDGCEYVKCVTCSHEFCWDCLEPHDHNMGGHVHGPRYKGPRPNAPYQALAPAAIQRRRRRRVRNVIAYTGIAVGAVVFGPPVVAVGAVAAILALPVVAVKAMILSIRRKKVVKRQTKEHQKRMHQWAMEEKKRREDLGLPVSDMVLNLAL